LFPLHSRICGLCESRGPRAGATIPRRAHEGPNEQFDELILDALEKDPTSSVGRIANMTKIAPATVSYILTNRLGFVSRKCRFVPHVLTETLRGLSGQINRVPIHSGSSRTNQLAFILTGEEFWFFY
jgi:hypothetical protein